MQEQIISLIRSTLYLSSYGGLSIYVLWEKQLETYLIQPLTVLPFPIKTSEDLGNYFWVEFAPESKVSETFDEFD